MKKQLAKLFPFPWRHYLMMVAVILLALLVQLDANNPLQGILALLVVAIGAYIYEVRQYHHGKTVHVIQPFKKRKS